MTKTTAFRGVRLLAMTGFRLGRAGAALLFAILLLDLCATGAWAQTTVSPTSLSFGSVSLGDTSNPKNVTLKN